jgi:hypothetical protein
VGEPGMIQRRLIDSISFLGSRVDLLRIIAAVCFLTLGATVNEPCR